MSGIPAHRHKHKPVFTSPGGRACPLCGKASYSLSGTHPQCSLESTDANSKLTRKERIAAKNLRARPRRDFSSW